MAKGLFVGCSVVDFTCLVDDFPQPDTKVPALANDIVPGGPALAAAVTFAHLGGDATLATTLGPPGIFRDFLAEDLVRHGVSVQDICNDPEYGTPLSLVVSARRQGTRTIIIGASDGCAKPRDRLDLFTDECDIILLDQYERHFVERHWEAIKGFEGPVVLDGGGWKDWSAEFLRLVDIPIVSEVYCSEGARRVNQMCAELGIRRWAMTRGGDSILWREDDREGEIPALKVKAIDTLGAGDIFHGAFCYSYAESGKFVEALEYANGIAAKSCESLGTRGWMGASG